MNNDTAIASAYQNASADFSSSKGAAGSIEGCPIKEKTWIGVLVRDLDSMPLRNQDVRVVLDTGQVLTGRTDAKGYVRFENVEPGSGEVTVIGIPEQKDFESDESASGETLPSSPTLVDSQPNWQKYDENEPFWEPAEIPEEELNYDLSS
jgi:hypothetical protein